MGLVLIKEHNLFHGENNKNKNKRSWNYRLLKIIVKYHNDRKYLDRQVQQMLKTQIKLHLKEQFDQGLQQINFVIHKASFRCINVCKPTF